MDALRDAITVPIAGRCLDVREFRTSRRRQRRLRASSGLPKRAARRRPAAPCAYESRAPRDMAILPVRVSWRMP